MGAPMTRWPIFFLLIILLSILPACSLSEDELPTAVLQRPASSLPAPTPPAVTYAAPPPRTAAGWLSTPVHGAVIEIGYGGPDEYNDPPYPSIASLKQLRALGVEVVTLEFQYAWTIEPPYQADETQFTLVTAALDNIAEAGLTAVVAVRNGPGRNAMMPDIEDDEVISTLYEDAAALFAYQEMLRDVVGRFRDRPEIIGWEPLVEPALDWYLTGEEEPPYPQAAALWNKIAPQLIAAIRDQDPERPILIEPVNWGGPDGFLLLDRFEDDNLIYSLHTYEPFTYTHQETPPYRSYPGRFDGEAFDKETLEELLQPVITFQEQYGVPVVVGEWGGIRWLPGIDQYIADQLSLFGKYGWSWFWYAWDDEEWDELGFELQMGSSRASPQFDLTTPAFALLVTAWQEAQRHESPDGQRSDFDSQDDQVAVPDLVGESAGSPAVPGNNNWQPALNATWQWQLSLPIDESIDVDIIDIDLFDNDADVVAALHDQGRKVICYISVGSWEDWRPDKEQFPAVIIGNEYDGWPGENWLDIRRIDLLAPIITARLDMCQAKGFDGIEPDNIDSYTNDTGFPLTYQDQLQYNIWLAKEALARGLSIGLKNDSEQAHDLLPYFDWALTEDCFDQGWCAEMLPFIAAGKPVFAAEYTDTGSTLNEFCPQASAMNISAILKNRSLDAWREACPPLPPPFSEAGTNETPNE